MSEDSKTQLSDYTNLLADKVTEVLDNEKELVGKALVIVKQKFN
jgi:hypothetical protein